MIIPANTVHKVIHGIQKRSSIPVISILDCVADVCLSKNLKKVGIMGTRWTMADHLYQAPLFQRGITEIIPSIDDQKIIQEAIFSELIPTGKASDKTLQKLLIIVNKLKAQGCDGIASACTELPLVLNDHNCGLITLDTTDILAESAVQQGLLLLGNNVSYNSRLN